MYDLSGSPCRNLRILIVEESDINRRLAQHLFAQVGLTADAVSNGHDAVKAFQASRYDLILMDCRLPGFPQFMATRIMRLQEGKHGRVQRIPIIGLTAFAPPGFHERCLRAGMDVCYEKPFNSKKLQQILARWLPAALASSAAA